MALWEYLWSWSGITKWLYHLNWNANDSSWNGNHGTATNITWVGWKLWSGAASFNGSSSVITLPNNLWYTYNWAITFLWWLRPNTTTTNNNCPVCLLESTWQTWFLLSFMASNVIHYWVEKSCVGWIPTYTYATPTDRWTHFAVTLNNGTAKLYINSELKASWTNTWAWFCNSLNTWHLWDWPTFRWKYNWKMDEAKVELKEFTAAEIKKHYTYSLWRFIQ